MDCIYKALQSAFCIHPEAEAATQGAPAQELTFTGVCSIGRYLGFSVSLKDTETC